MTAPGDGKVVDFGLERFGIGDWDPTAKRTFTQWRIGEIQKVKAIRTRRGVEPYELLRALEYCAENGIYPRTWLQIFEHITAAQRWHLARERSLRTQALQRDLARALAIEAERPGSDWFDRLTRAAGPEAQEEVLAEWRKSSASP